MSATIRKVIHLGSWIVLAVLISDAISTYVNLRTIGESISRIGRTRGAVLEIERTLSVLKDAETGQRGYLLTGKDRYLAPYRAADAEMEKALNRLEVLTSENPIQQASVLS